MGIMDEQHQIFRVNSENPAYQKHVIKTAPIFRRYIKVNFALDKNIKNKKIVSYINWLLQISEKDYYLLQAPNDNSAFSLTNIDFGSMVLFKFSTGNTDATKKILKKGESIEIVQLHSRIKGSGSKIINEFIKLSKDIQLPLVLYAETDSLVKYYEQFNFKNYGKHGDNNEFLMIRIPESNRKFKFKF